MWAATLIPAAAVAALPTVAASIRARFLFRFDATSGTLLEVASIAGANARVLGAVLVAAVAVRAGVARRLLDVVAAAVVLGNAAFVGMALGAYGDRALPWLVHLPLEWAALATALAVYLAARRRPIGLDPILLVGAGLAGLVVAAAFTESYLTPQR